MDGGLNCLEPGTREFQRWRHDPGSANSLPSDNVRFVDADLSGYPVDRDQPGPQPLLRSDIGEFTHFRNEQRRPQLPRQQQRSARPHRPLGDALDLHDQRLDPLGSGNPGVPDLSRTTRADPTSISTNNIRSILEDSQGRLWVSTNRGGLNYLDRQTGTFRSYTFDQSDPGSLSNNSPHAIFQDQSGILWVGTWGGGCAPTTRGSNASGISGTMPRTSNSLKNPIVWTITEGPEGDLWFGMNSGWMDRYDRKTGPV